MRTITNTNDLQKAITELEIKQAAEALSLKRELWQVQQNLKPMNVLKSTLREAMSSSEIKSGLVNTAVNLTIDKMTGVLPFTIAKKILQWGMAIYGKKNT